MALREVVVETKVKGTFRRETKTIQVREHGRRTVEPSKTDRRDAKALAKELFKKPPRK